MIPARIALVVVAAAMLLALALVAAVIVVGEHPLWLKALLALTVITYTVDGIGLLRRLWVESEAGR